MQGQPTGVASHHLANNDASVAAGGRMQAIKGIGCGGHGRLEPEGEIGALDIIIDCLGNPDTGDAGFEKRCRATHRPVATDDDQRVEFVLFDVGHAPVGGVDETGRSIGVIADVVVGWSGPIA